MKMDIMLVPFSCPDLCAVTGSSPVGIKSHSRFWLENFTVFICFV